MRMLQRLDTKIQDGGGDKRRMKMLGRQGFEERGAGRIRRGYRNNGEGVDKRRMGC